MDMSFAVVQCPSLDIPGKMNMSCSRTAVFGTVCEFTCPDDWTLNGSAVLTCGATGHWSGMPPTCEGKALMDGGCLGEQREGCSIAKEANCPLCPNQNGML